MSKYSAEFKLEVIKYYFKEKHGVRYVAEYFNIPSRESVRIWVKQYKEHGIEGIIKNQKPQYSGSFKEKVIEYMHNNNLSETETAIHFNLGSHSVVSKWKRIYYEKGPQALYKEESGRTKNMNRKQKKEQIEEKNKENIIEENKRLRMENEYLKKLNALVQERIKQKNKKK